MIGGPSTAAKSSLSAGTIVIIVGSIGVCALLLLILFYLKRQKDTENHKMVITNLNDVNRNAQTVQMPTVTAPVYLNDPQPDPPQTEADDSKYSIIIHLLKQCDPDDWRQYLAAFKAEKLTDQTLRHLPCDPNDDTQPIWKELLPPMGIRVAFKTDWKQQLEWGDSNFNGELKNEFTDKFDNEFKENMEVHEVDEEEEVEILDNDHVTPFEPEEPVLPPDVEEKEMDGNYGLELAEAPRQKVPNGMQSGGSYNGNNGNIGNYNGNLNGNYNGNNGNYGQGMYQDFDDIEIRYGNDRRDSMHSDDEDDQNMYGRGRGATAGGPNWR